MVVASVSMASERIDVSQAYQCTYQRTSREGAAGPGSLGQLLDIATFLK